MRANAYGREGGVKVYPISDIGRYSANLVLSNWGFRIYSALQAWWNALATYPHADKLSPTLSATCDHLTYLPKNTSPLVIINMSGDQWQRRWQWWWQRRWVCYLHQLQRIQVQIINWCPSARWSLHNRNIIFDYKPLWAHILDTLKWTSFFGCFCPSFTSLSMVVSD